MKKAPNDGIYLEMPDAEYREVDAASYSALKLLARSPMHLNKASYKGTPSMALGRAVNDALFFGEHSVKLTKAQGVQFNGMLNALSSHPFYQAFMKAGPRNAEVSCFVWDDTFGVRRKCRIDYLTPELVIDLKTTTDASPDGFAKAVGNYGYDLQAAYYLDILRLLGEPRTFVNIAVESSPPHAVGVYSYSDYDLQVADATFLELLNTYAVCKTSGKWPGYSQKIVQVRVPKWAQRSR